MDSAAPTLSSEPSRFNLPARLRALVRRSEFALIGVAVLVGGFAGAFVAVIRWTVALLHHLLFGMPLAASSLSGLTTLAMPWLALVPAAGGLFLGVTGLLIRKWRPRRPIDPIEANALQGGRMSLIDSLLITAQTVVSSGVGGSVGLEAGFTQIGSGFASVVGAALKLRRSDMRTLVGCGAAGAIGAAFGAPLTGAFYAFELIVGTYTPFGLAPIVSASISGVLVVKALGIHGTFIGQLAPIAEITQSDLAALLMLALFCSSVGIGIMRAVTFVEVLFRRSHLPVFLQPAVGGLVLGGLALVTPKVLSSGHGGLFELFGSVESSLVWLSVIVLLKSIASAVSIGSGFRGGLFFASLFLGAMIGKVFAIAVPMLAPAIVPDSSIYAAVGMSALAVAIIGGPLTMSFLALETTGDFQLVIMVLIASTIVSVIVRQTFGYSFATWRMHLRGESIRSAQDVSWMRTLTVGRMMKTDVRTVMSYQKIADFMEEFPLGSRQWVVATDAAGRYAGLVSVTDAHLAASNGEDPQAPIETLLRYQEDVLFPGMNIKDAADIFERSESEALAVLGDLHSRQIVGMLTEAHVLRRYTEELEKARRELSGEKWLGEA
ncbi:chloride channel protein [Methylovirgula sp. HY1]|uniref:chloride channel protein n=1 Tax=Methylovirgula sp. HY1 TaxID=2822761 RepID=UPI001C5B0C08|nr:chloride channel protein [Methylovirgula sp. HY1]QXX75253.1 Voltage-gated ClC-type chloride channel ClcB [Methylovirgula sp. HY1]